MNTEPLELRDADGSGLIVTPHDDGVMVKIETASGGFAGFYATPEQWEQVTQGEWLPIERVPKDGSEVLLAHANSQWIDQWVDDSEWDAGGYWMMCDQWTDPETPTHYKPLGSLPPPSAALGEKQ